MNKKIIVILTLVLNLVFAQTDTDSDGFADDVDNSPLHWNPFQEDVDGDGIGDWSDPSTIRVSLSESYASHVVSLTDKINAALKEIYSEDRTIVSLEFRTSDDPNGHISTNASSYEISASDVSLLNFDTKYLYDYELSVTNKSSSSAETIDTLQLRIYIEDYHELTEAPRTVSNTREGLVEYRYKDPFSKDSEGTFGDINTQWRPPDFGESQAYYADINNDGLDDLIFGDYRTNYFGRNFNIHQVAKPVYLINKGNLAFDARYNDFENKTIIHSPNMTVQGDLNGDGKDEFLNFGEHYHTDGHSHDNYINEWMESRNLILGEDFDDESYKKFRYFSYDNSGLIDEIDRIENIPSLPDNPDNPNFFQSMYSSGLGDIDNDGDTDIIIFTNPRALDWWLLILTNDGNGNFISQNHFINQAFKAYEGHLLIYDVTGDGYNDILFGTMGDPGQMKSLSMLKGNVDLNFENAGSERVILDNADAYASVRNIYANDIDGDGSDEIIVYFSTMYGNREEGVKDMIPNYIRIYEIVDESEGHLNEITDQFFINDEDLMDFYASSAWLAYKDIDGDGFKDLVPKFALEPLWAEPYEGNLYRGDWNNSDDFQYFKYYPHLKKFKVVSVEKFGDSRNDGYPLLYNRYDFKDLNDDGVLEWIHVTDGRDVYIFEYNFGNYCGDSGNGQASFSINNLENDNYSRSLTEISLTPYFDCTSFVPEKYFMAVGDSESNLTNILDWTEVNLNDINLNLNISLNDHTEYFVSLKAENSATDSNDIVTQSFTTYKQLLGDSDNDWDLDINDLNAFVNAWPGIDIGPASGAAPYMMPSLDNKSDVFDMNVFTRNWLWSSSSREFERINTNTTSTNEHNIEFLKDENKISIIIPNDITSGRIQIDKSDVNTKYKIENNIGNMLLLQDDHEFYQISFGNLSKADGLVVIEVVNGTIPDELSIQSFKNDGSTASNKIILSKSENNFLYQNYPNPFSKETSIKFNLTEESDIEILIYDVRGRVVKTFDEGIKVPGPHELIWDGTNEEGDKVSSGIYFYQLRSKNYTKARKMTLIKN